MQTDLIGNVRDLVCGVCSLFLDRQGTIGQLIRAWHIEDGLGKVAS